MRNVMNKIYRLLCAVLAFTMILTSSGVVNALSATQEHNVTTNKVVKQDRSMKLRSTDPSDGDETYGDDPFEEDTSDQDFGTTGTEKKNLTVKIVGNGSVTLHIIR